MPRFSITIDDDIADLADAEARRTRSSRASVIRRALEAYLMVEGEGVICQPDAREWFVNPFEDESADNNVSSR